jgi:protein SCO1
MTTLLGWFVVCVALQAAALCPRDVGAHEPDPAAVAVSSTAWETARAAWPDTPVVDQDGNAHRFYSDLVKGRTVAINFVFTTCTSVCPPLTAVFRRAQQELGDRVGSDITLISISVDALNDTPDKLKQFASKFDVKPGWFFVTGKKPDIDRLLGSLGVFSGARDDHAPLTLIGNDSAGRWTRLHGLAQPSVLVATLNEAAQLRAPGRASVSVPAQFIQNVAERDSAAAPSQANARYFTNLPLQTQDKRSVRFYDDLIRGRIVLINAMFTGCTSVCSPVTANLHRAQSELGEALAQRVHFISITVDPLNDTPEALKAYAQRHAIDAGWVFLTGKRENVDWVLHKLGAFTHDAQDHSTALIIGNDATGEWVKMMATAAPADIVRTVRRLAGPTPL